MADWPLITFPQQPIVVSPHSAFYSPVGRNYGWPSDGTTWPSANRAIYCPLTLAHAYRVRRLAVINHSAVSGNIDVGIYSSNGTRIVSAGSTAQSGTSAPQYFDITDTDLAPGSYYLAVAMDNTTGGVWRSSPNSVRHTQLSGCAQQASAFPLPATATFATVSSTLIPFMAMVGGNVL